MIKIRAKILRFQLQLIILVIFHLAASAQTKSEKKKIFAQAESYYLFEEYDIANQLYSLLDSPDNMNIKYKIGACYLNTLEEREKAIPYLESSIKNSSYFAKSTSFKEKRSPLDAYFLLAKAYMINNELEKAIITLQKFKKLMAEIEVKGGMKNLAYIDQEILACKNGIKYQENPFKLSKRILGSAFSQGTINENPAVSFDGNTIVYTERRGVVNAIMYSKKRGEEWQTPVEITIDLVAGDDCTPCSLNHDGTLLFLYKNDNFDGNIYSSELKNGNWTPIKKLNRNINTKFYESHAAISSDSKKLYFASNREGGNGGLDLYVSEKDALGDWGVAINLGTAINTDYNEDTPFITLNDSLLYFSSEGHSSMGGYDIFRSQRSGKTWKSPENIGSPVNSTDDDRFFQPINNGRNGYYAMISDYKDKDIFYFTFESTALNRIFEIKGKYSLRDTILNPDYSYFIYLLNRVTGDTLDFGFPSINTGMYNFIVAPGKFKLVYTGVGYLSQSIDTSIVVDNSPMVINLDVILDRDPNYSGDVAETPDIYKKINLSDIPAVSTIDSSTLLRNVQLNDVTDNDAIDTTLLYYTVQVMALYNPVDISYFRYVSDIKVIYSESDMFYKYTTGRFMNKEEAYAHKNELIRKGYPDDLFVKKVSKIPVGKLVMNRSFFTIQLKAMKIPADIKTLFSNYKGVRESKEIDGLYHYLYGRYESFSEAKSALDSIQDEEFKDAFVRKIIVLVK